MWTATSVLLMALLPATARADGPWARHTIDGSSRGADGVRLADANGDGLTDLVTGWEEGGVIRVYLHPGAKQARSPWPAVTVGRVKSPEDALLVDVDGDGSLDVVSCCEGKTRTVFVHWAPRDDYLNPDGWLTTALPVTQGKEMWMYALPMQIDARHGVDLIVGSKGDNASVSWLQAPEDPRRVEDWQLHRLRDCGWIMSLEPHDMDGDGDQDVVVSDRKGKNRGVLWLEYPGAGQSDKPWPIHPVPGTESYEVMFLDVARLDPEEEADILVPTRNKSFLLCRRIVGVDGERVWSRRQFANPFSTPHGKAVRIGDIDLDGRPDAVHTANTGGNRETPGVVWMSLDRDSKQWTAHDISGKQGVKFDLIQLVDVDADGDLDVITCEERDNLGVFWYENPAR